MSQVALREIIPDRELMYSGHFACPGCGAALSMRLALKAMGPKTVVVIPACCWSIIAGPYPTSSLGVPLFHTLFESAAVTAAGIRAALDLRGKTDVAVMAWAGDGGTFDIGIQSLSGTAERNDDIVYVCYDNEAYMNTGIQRSSATPWGAWTTTTPAGAPKSHPKKRIMEIMAGHRVPYAATATIGYPDDLVRKIAKARSIPGTKFIHLLSPCPPGWKSADEESIEIARMAVRYRIFPLYEIEGGERYVLSMDHPGGPVRDYLVRQGRFRHLTEDQIATIQANVDHDWDVLTTRIRAGGSVGASA